MRVLAVSNLYPPHFIGGYELGCRDVVEALRSRGHDVRVLTSTYGVGRPAVEGHVHRWMEAEWEWPTLSPRVRRYWLLRKEARNQRAFRRVVREFRPDVVHMWNPAAASLSPARIAQELGVPVVYLVSDGWLARLASGGDEWERLVRLPPPTLYSRLFRGLTRRAGLHGSLPEPPLDPVQFVSDYLRREVEAAGCALRSAEVVPWGVDVERFSFRREPIAAPRRLLYVGQLMPHKGVHTCIEALQVLRRDPHRGSVTLDIVGSGIDPSYVERLHELARTYGLTEAVRFTGAMPPSELPAVYRAADVVVFSSIWPEPFSIALLEAMASGVPVVATCTGGSAEILRDGVNALVYRAGDAGDCARQLARALADPAMLEELRGAARRIVEERYRFDTMVGAIERRLLAVAATPR